MARTKITPNNKTTIIKQWLKALRSGKYKQGRGALCVLVPNSEELKFCCFGVLCEVLNVSREGYHYKFGPNISISWPPKPELAKLGINDGLADELIARNDGTCDFPKSTFKTIANRIEKELLPNG